MFQIKNNIQIKILSKLIYKKYYLRELSSELDEIPSTIFRNLNILQKEKIIDSYVEGKNKYFYIPKRITSMYIIKSIQNFKTLSFFEKHISKISLIEEIMKITTKSESVVIFGSYAKGIEKNISDLDLLIIDDDSKLKEKLLDVEEKHSIEINPKIVKEVDINNLLVKEIIKNHIILKGGYFINEQIFNNLSQGKEN